MKITLISTQAKITSAWLAVQLAPLGSHEPTVSMICLTRPAEALPIERCLVLGRSLRPGRRVGFAPVSGSPATRPVSRNRIDRVLARVVPDRWARDNAVLASVGVRWSRDAKQLFKAADLVIALDANATWAAWHLARRIPGPEVVYGVAGAVRKLSELADGR